MKIIFVLLLAIGLSISDKLDRTYLPPPGSQFSGGSVDDLKTPLDLPKQYFTTGGPQTLFPQGQSENQESFKEIYSDRINSPSTFSNNEPPSTERVQRVYNVPTTTTSYAFSQTTTYSPIEDNGNSRNNLLPGRQNVEYYQPHNQGQDFSQLSQVLPSFNQPMNNQHEMSTEKYLQNDNFLADQRNPNQNQNAFIPSLNNYNQKKQYESPINDQKTFKTPIREQVFNSYGPKFDGLTGKAPQFNENTQFSTSAPDLPYLSSQSLNPENSKGKLTTQLSQLGKNYTNLIPDTTQTYYESETLRLPSTTPDIHSTDIIPNRLPESSSQISPIYGNAQVAYPSHSDSTNQLKPYDNNAVVSITTQNYDTYTGSSKFSVPKSTPFTNIDFTTKVPYKFSDISDSSIPLLSANANLSTPIRAERPQAQGDRNAVILNYENKLSPEGFSFSFDTSNGIHADESGTALNGVKAQGGYSYIGDDGKEYSIIYTADENGFLPRGDHLPTPPPIPEAILRVIEQAKKNKEAGIIEDGFYDDNKYGYKKYQGPIEFYRPKYTKYTKNNRTSYINQNNQSLKPGAIYNSEINKEDTMDYIEEDVNALDGIKTSGQYSPMPNTQFTDMDLISTEKHFNVKNDATGDDQKATIGINRRPGLKNPNINQENTNNQNGISMDNINTVTQDRNQQTTPNKYIYMGQNFNKKDNQQPFIPDNTEISYITRANGKIPPRQQRPLKIYGTAQNKYEMGDDVTALKENKQQPFNPNIISNSEPLRNIGQNTGYEYIIPKKSFGRTQNTQIPYYNVPVTKTDVNSEQKVTAKPFKTPIIDSSEDSEETQSENNGDNSNSAKFVKYTPIGSNSINRITPSQSPQKSYSEGTGLNFEVTENSQKEYLPSDNKYSQYNFQGQMTPATEQSVTSVLPSSSSEYVTTYRPITISGPFNVQTLPTRTSSSPLQQSRAEYEKRYPTTTYRPNYVIKDTQVSNVNLEMADKYGRPAGQINEGFLAQNDNQMYTQSQTRPSLNLESTERIQSNQLVNYSSPSITSGQNNPAFLDHGITVRPNADINGKPEAINQIKQTQAYQNIGSSYPVGPETIAEDKYGRPLISPGKLNQGHKINLPDYTIPNDQATTNNSQNTGLPYQVSPTKYNNQGGQEMKGEDFSGPRQEQKFDPQTGYYYK